MERPFSYAKIYTALNKEYKAILLEKLYSFYDEKSGLPLPSVILCPDNRRCDQWKAL